MLRSMAVVGNSFGKVCPILGENAIGKSRIQSPTPCPSFSRLNATAAELAIDGSSYSSLAEPSSIRWAQLALQGPRSEMEDESFLEMNSLPDFTFAAVFDGHSGLSSATYLKKELFSACVEQLQGGALLESSDNSTLQNLLSQAFVQVDQKLLSCRLDQEASDKDSGSTATVMFLGKEKLVVAHVGDSRVVCVIQISTTTFLNSIHEPPLDFQVLSRGGRAEDLTSDHRPFGSSKKALSEQKRIISAGGWISNGRVCGSLSVSRAFGDASLKTRRKEMLEEALRRKQLTPKFVSKLDLTGEWLTAEPDVNAVQLGQDVEFIILASDGLWDSMKSNDVVKFVRDQLKEHGDSQRACEALGAAALARKTQDNVTIIIADLGKVPRQEQQLKEAPSSIAEGIKQVLITSALLLLSIYASQLASSLP